MSQELHARIYAELSSLVLIDPHSHINPHQPASKTLADILGYHYYTELAHSAGMAKSQIEEPRLPPKEKVARLIANLGPIDNTIQYSWLLEMAQQLLGFQGESIGPENWEDLYDLAEAKMAAPDWADEVLKKSNLEAVFLTNEFDDPLTGFDTDRYIPCLRTDDLVFNLAKVDVVERLERATGTSVTDAASLHDAIACLFTHFKANGARACAISLPPDFEPSKVSKGRAQTAIDSLLRRGLGASESDKRAAANFVFWTLAENCAQAKLPFDLMIGVNRGVYEGGVHQGRDLYDSRVSLIQYKALFNAFPRVVFPISVLASVTNQELVSYSWIFPNVVTNGHWWYSNTPTFIEHDLASRLEAVPRTKQIGYYSDMYKLEFALPKFNMYKRILAKVLAERYVVDRGWSETRAVDFGKQVLRGNVESLFGFNGEPWTPSGEGVQEISDWSAPAASKSAAAKPAWLGAAEPAQSAAGFGAGSSAAMPSSPFGGIGGLAAMGAGAAAVAGTTAAAMSAFQHVEAPPLPEENFDLEEFEEEELSDEQMIDFEPEADTVDAGAMGSADSAGSGIDLEEAPTGSEGERSLLGEQPFVAEAPHADSMSSMDDPPSDIPVEFSFDSGDLSEGTPQANLNVAEVEMEEIDADSIEETGTPGMDSSGELGELSLEPEEEPDTGDEATFFMNAEVVEDTDKEAEHQIAAELAPLGLDSLASHIGAALESTPSEDDEDMFAEVETKDPEAIVGEEVTPLGVEALEPRVEFSMDSPVQAETADDDDMFAGLEEMKESEPETAEALAPLGMQALEPHVPFSLEPAKPVEEAAEDSEIVDFETLEESAAEAEELGDIELEELDFEDLEIADEMAETTGDELNFEDLDEKTDKDKKRKEN